MTASLLKTLRPAPQGGLFQNILASLVAFLVAVPLCLGISLAAGLPVEMGLISGIIGGIVVGALSGCPLMVSGPAAGVVAVIWEIIQQHGLEHFGIIVVAAGLFQVLFAFLKLGQWFRAVPPAVVQGMLAGIGVLIFASQFHVMLDDLPKGSAVENIMSIPDTLMKGLFPLDGATHHLAALVGALTIAVLIIWNLLPAPFKKIPASLVAVMAAIGVAQALNLPIKYVSVPPDLWGDIRWPQAGDLGYILYAPALISAFTLAVVASAESLLTAVAVEKLRPGLRTLYDRELFAQAMGNILVGLVGAIPITGVMVRSAANVQAQAQGRTSTVLHGVWLLLFLMFVPFLLTYIPVASLAAILVYTGYKLVHVESIRDLWQVGKSQVLIYGVTLVMIVTTDLLEGLIIGLALMAGKLLLDQSRLDITLRRQVSGHPEQQVLSQLGAKQAGSQQKQPVPEQIVFIQLSGNANFINMPKLAAMLEGLSPGQEVHLSLADLNSLDHTCLEFLRQWETRYAETGGTIYIDGGLYSPAVCKLPPVAAVR